VRGLLESVFGSVVMVADATSLIEAAGRLHPDVAVVDLSLAPSRGLSWLSTLRRRCPSTAIVAISVHDEDTVREAALAAGADAFVLKRALATDLLPAIVRAGAGFTA
jgi:DNA-binding NarL/FixJ family response regulator